MLQPQAATRPLAKEHTDRMRPQPSSTTKQLTRASSTTRAAPQGSCPAGDTSVSASQEDAPTLVDAAAADRVPLAPSTAAAACGDAALAPLAPPPAMSEMMRDSTPSMAHRAWMISTSLWLMRGCIGGAIDGL